MNKKAFEVQFNWIFILVAGAAIMLFFAAVIVKQKGISEASSKTTILKSVEAIVTGASVSTDTINIIDIPNSNIEVSCNRVSLGGPSRQYQNLILFAPSLIKGDKLITQTLAFSTPYRATNLLYATSPQLRYIIIGNNNLAKDINRTLPYEMKKEFHQSTPQIRNSNNYKVRFIVFEDMPDFPKSLEKMPDSDVTAIRVNGDNEKGTIEFWQKNGNLWLHEGSSTYIGKSSLIGALYSDTLSTYECNMQNSFSRLKLVTKIYLDRTKELHQEAQQSGTSSQLQCSQFYSNALTQLNSIYSASSNFDKQSTDTISDATKSLSSENKNAQVYSCALIY